ncbi:MAG TPA: ABC transporter substrate-binding protein [Syntrophorhabdaceae bacterium]|nr:ABC transporter substrate-binding protein [Syntrophorhabdaceae bacterium]
MKSKTTTVLVSTILTIASFLLGITVYGAASPPVSGSITKKLIIVTPTEPDTLDLNSSKMDGAAAPIAENITERLVAITNDGKFVPGLASSWKISPDGKEIDFFLKKGVKFHNGDPFTAKDVLFSHERGMNPTKGSTTLQRTMRYLESITMINDYQVRYRFKSPDAQILPGRPVPIESKTYFDRVGEEKFLKEPVGTGPYRFVRWEPGQYIEMKINENYWGEKPAVKEARFVFVKEDTTRVSMLKAGEADMILECPFALVKEIEKAGFKTAKLSAHPSVSLQFHTYNPKVPWYDKRVRLALAMAIDTKSMVDKLFQGIPTRPVRLNTWELGYDKDLKPYPYDPAKAKKLLAEAGYANGFDMPLYYFIGRASGQKETAEMVALYLNAIGVRCKVEGIEAIRLIEKVREWRKSTDTVYAGVATVPTANYADPTQALEIGFYSKSPISFYVNPAFDVVLELARSSLDDKKRAEFIKRAFRIIQEEVPTALLWNNVSIYAMQKNLSFTPTIRAIHAMVFLKDIKPAK